MNDFDAGERPRDRTFIAHVSALEFDPGPAILVFDQIEDPNVVAAFEQMSDDDFAEVAGSTGHEHFHRKA